MSIWIAKLLGPIILTLGVTMAFTPRNLQEMTKQFLADRPLILISGVLAMIAGLSIVNTHNLWNWDWRLIITLFGWALVIGGIFRVAAPGLVLKVGESMMDQPIMTRLVGICWSLLGAFLTFKGYA
ncbi:MAG: hypothetical protein GXP16_18720 [Gammaproteobacteria bacterium]|nr:hypothetical protein [Gammaproteobacteria bacterium]